VTLWEDIYKLFFGKIEKDADFFMYNNVPIEEALAIATKRAKFYLLESISKLTSDCTPDIDFNNYDEVLEVFNIDLTNNEKDLLADLMKEKYFEKDMALLKAFQVKFTTKDLNIASPANERKTFIDMFKEISSENRVKIKRYASRDRITGKLKTIKYVDID